MTVEKEEHSRTVSDGPVERQPEAVSTHTTIIEKESSGSGSGLLIGIIVLFLLIVGGYFAIQMMQGEVAETTAITEAAGEVGDAAGAVGDAAEGAADAIEDATGQ